MAKKPKTDEAPNPENAQIPNNPEEQIIDVAPEDPSVQEIQEMLEREDLAGGSLRLERRGPTDNGYAYIGKMKVSNFSLEDVKRIYGGGDYQVEFFRSNGQKGGRQKFSIDPRFVGAIDISKAAGSQNSGLDATVIKSLIDAQAESRKPDPAVAAAQQAALKAQQDNTALLIAMMNKSAETQATMMAGMMQAMAQAMGSRSGNENGLGVKELLVLIPLLKGGESKQMDLLQMVEAMKGIKELSSGEPAVSEPKSFMDKLVEALPHVATTVAALKGVPTLPVARPALPSPNLPAGAATGANGTRPSVTATPPATTPATTTPSPEGANQLAQGLAIIVKAAREKRDVGLYHDMILEMVSEGDLPMLNQVLTGDGWFATLFGNLPDAEAVKPWLTELRTQIVETLNSPEEDNPSDEPTKPATPASTPESGPSQPDSTGVRPESGADGAS